MNFQISDRVTIARPGFGHEPHIDQTGTIARAFKSLRGAKSYAVSLPCLRHGVQVVTFAAKELELAIESDAEEPTSPLAAMASPEAKSAYSGGRKCQRCGGPPPELLDVSRCMHWVGGRRCGGAIESS